jgi:hypothetical protein
MNATLMKALVAFVLVCLLLVTSAGALTRHKTLAGFLQVVAASCFVVVVLTHVAEALWLFPAMRWGEPDSVGTTLIWRALGSASRCW